MGKKVKKKIRNTQKERRDSSGSHGSAEGVLVVKEKRVCPHIEKGIDLSKVKDKFGETDTVKCQGCKVGGPGKGRSKHGKKGGRGELGKKKESKCVWVCLQCGNFACGGVGLPTTPQCHAIQHNRQCRHPCVVLVENPNLCWCFPCSSLLPVGKLEQDDGAENNVLLDVVKLIKRRSEEERSIDVEDVWFGSGGLGGAMMGEAKESVGSDGKGGYIVRGLQNLGNTCFFNSVMQNLLSMDKLRDYFLNLDRSVGPLTMALKKLFAETCEADLRNGVSPRSLFGCICSRAPQFRGYQQQDSHELLRCLLDSLCTEELNIRKSSCSSKEDEVTSNLGPTFVDAIFAGQLSSTVSCMECNHSSVVYEPFLDLSLPVPTKKSPSKKVPPVSRSRKGKLPMKHEAKKGGKIRGKGKIGSAPVLLPSENSAPQSVPSENSAPQLLPSENSVPQLLHSENSASQLLPFEMGSSETTASSSLVPPCISLEEENVDLFADSWLDFIGSDTPPDVIDSVSQNYNICSAHVSESKDIPNDDDMLETSSESQSQVILASIEPIQTSDLSKENSFENDLPLLQGSEVLLLPYKEASLITGVMTSQENEASSSTLGHEQNPLEFDGFGDLFNEPEMDPLPNLEDKSTHELEVAQKGLSTGNNSESDPDEVDDTDAPVSINSCLAYFTKAELLSENAWHCEKCSKSLQDQQACSKENQSQAPLMKKLIGVQLRSQNDPLDGELLNLNAESRILENGDPQSSFGSTIEKDEDNDCSGDTVEEISPIMTDCISSDQVSFVDQDRGSNRVNDSDSTGSNANQVHSVLSQSKVNGRDSDDKDKVDGKRVKVMRDATKRILINKAPPILTIHLKRFSQDARGRLSKLSGHVNFHDKLDLSPYLINRSKEEKKCEYRLMGVVEHSGTMRGGHYVAYVRGNKRRGKTEEGSEESTWFYASDAFVREVSSAEVFRSEAYILFYEKV